MLTDTETGVHIFVYLVLIWQMLTTSTTGDEDVSKDEHKAENGPGHDSGG